MSALKTLRETVFRRKRKDFAEIAGVNPSTVHRWEAGETTPTLDAITRIREFARGPLSEELASRGLSWDDAWLFDPPSIEDGRIFELQQAADEVAEHFPFAAEVLREKADELTPN